MSRPTESRLAESLEQLTDIAAEAGLDPAAARDEGLRVAAALAESVPGAAADWARVADPGLTELGRINEAFFDAASRGRRWRGAPTDLLEALVVSRHTLAGRVRRGADGGRVVRRACSAPPRSTPSPRPRRPPPPTSPPCAGAPGSRSRPVRTASGSAASWSGILPPLPEGPAPMPCSARGD